MKVNEVFESIQGEGKYAGYPVLFIRLSGCTRDCKYCDTKYHTQGEELSIQQVVDRIDDSKLPIVVWTGGEPSLQAPEIYQVIQVTNKQHHLETNADIKINYQPFQYVSFSPKDCEIARQVKQLTTNWDINKYDIKVVTNLALNKYLIPYATMLMPLSTFDLHKDNKIRQKVFRYCVKHNIRYCARLQVEIFGKKRGV